MVIYFEDVLGEDFIKTLPNLIKLRARHLAKSKKKDSMNEYLIKNYNLTIDDIIDEMEFSINHYSDKYSLMIDNNTIESKSHQHLISLIKLIDYGNFSVRGLNIINTSMYYINQNLKNIYRMYKYGGIECQ